MEAHPDADHLVALLVEQRRRDGAVDAAGHRDEDAGHGYQISARSSGGRTIGASSGRSNAVANGGKFASGPLVR